MDTSRAVRKKIASQIKAANEIKKKIERGGIYRRSSYALALTTISPSRITKWNVLG